MPDLGAIAKDGSTGRSGGGAPSGGPGGGTAVIAGVVLGHGIELLGFTARDDSEGNPLPPSQWQQRPGVLRDLRLVVRPGFYTFKVDVRYVPDAAPRPTVTVKAAPGVLAADVAVVASAGAGWVTIAVPFTATGDGVLAVWREFANKAAGAYVKWTNARMS